MKEKILKVVDELSKNEYFNKCSVSLNINYDEQMRMSSYNNGIMNYNSFINKIDELKKIVNSFTDEIDGYNLTLKKERGTNRGSGDYNYDHDWKSVEYIFWSGGDYSNPNPDKIKYGMFEWRFLSNMESFDPNGIRNKLSKYIYDKEEDPDGDDGHHVFGNYFEYDNVEVVINALIELDLLMDKQYKEKCLIYDKIRLYI